MAKGLKTGGREPGTCNIVTKEIRESFQSLVEQNLPELQNWLTLTAQKEPGRAIELVLKLSEFCLPKLKATELTANFNDQTIIVVPPNFSPDERDKRIKELKKKLFDEDKK